MTKRITLTRKGFREWLEGKPGEEVVGYGCQPHNCPLARHLRDLGMKEPSVGVSNITALGGAVYEYAALNKISTPAPAWAQRLLNGLDKFGSSAPITARQALAVLDGKEAGA